MSDPIANRGLANREAFTVPQRVPSDALYIGPPFIGRRDGSRTFDVSRRIEDADHEFEGVVVARIEFDYLAGFYAGVNVTPDTAIRLARNDGVILAQYPKEDEAKVEDVEGRVPVASGGGNPTLAKNSRMAQSNQIVISEEVAGYPIVIEVRRSTAGIIQPWIQQELSSAARTLPLAILASVLLIALLGSLRRRDRWGGSNPRPPSS